MAMVAGHLPQDCRLWPLVSSVNPMYVAGRRSDSEMASQKLKRTQPLLR